MAEYDPLYVAARGVLLDALEALGPQRDAIIVVGAQAIYIRIGEADIAVAPYTTDADLALTPLVLEDEPHLEELLKGGDFFQEGKPGAWLKTVPVGDRNVAIPVDIMVPQALAPPGGTRGARIPPHDKMAARKALGLEGAAIDYDAMEVAALGADDTRRFVVRVAGLAALLVAKLHKLHDRLESGKQDRIADKDAADIYRIMQAVSVESVAPRLGMLLADSIAEVPSKAALVFLEELFGAPLRSGVRMAIDALRPGVLAATVETVCTTFARQVRENLATGR